MTNENEIKTPDEIREAIRAEESTPDSPRPWTVDEMRGRFLRAVWGAILSWERESRAPSVREKLEGLAFSMLATIDGATGMIPAFRLIPDPHKSDEAFSRSEGTNWWEPLDIGGALHEEFRRYAPAEISPKAVVVAPVSEEPPPPAGGYLEHAAELAGFRGRVRDWARTVLEREAEWLVHGRPAIEKTTPEEISRRLLHLRRHTLTRYIETAVANGVDPKSAADFAAEMVRAAEEGRKPPEEPKIVVAKTLPPKKRH